MPGWRRGWGKAGFDEAMLAVLAGEKTLAADDTPVNVLDNAPQQRTTTISMTRRRTRRRRAPRTCWSSGPRTGG